MQPSSEIDLIEYLLILYRKKKLIGVFALVGLVVGTIYAVTMPVLYRTQANIFIEEGGSGLILPAPLIGLATSAGLSLQSIPAMTRYSGYLESLSLPESIVERHPELIPRLYDISPDLPPEEREKRMKGITIEMAGGVLKGMISFEEAVLSGAISIYAVAESPEFAADVANLYVEGLREYINRHEMIKARHKQMNLEAQILNNQVELFEATKLVREYYEGKRIPETASKVTVTMQSADLVKGPEISVAYSNLDLGKPSHNPEDGDMAVLRKKTQELQEKLKSVSVTGVSPQIYLEYLNGRALLLKQLQVLLSQQYENAKIEVASAVPGFHILDSARVPRSKWKPKYQAIYTAFLLSSLGMSVLTIFGMEYFKKWRSEHS